MTVIQNVETENLITNAGVKILEITNEHIYVYQKPNSSVKITYKLEDLGGCFVGKSSANVKQTENKYTLKILFFEKIDDAEIISRKFRAFEFFSNDDETLKIFTQWKKKLRNICFKTCSNWKGKDFSVSPREFVVILNPSSGNKMAVKDYDTIVKPCLKYQGINTEICITESLNHLKELSKTLDFNKYDAILLFGGDGTIHHLINSIIKENPNHKDGFSTPVAIFPSGTGNGIICSICDEKNEKVNFENLCYHLMRGETKKISLSNIKIRYQDGTKNLITREMISCLSASWGIVADIDMSNEKFNFFGEIGQTICGLKVIVTAIPRESDIYLLPLESNDGFSEDPFNQPLPASWEKAFHKNDAKYIGVLTTLHRKIDKNICITTKIRMGEDSLWVLLLIGEKSKYYTIRGMINGDVGRYVSGVPENILKDLIRLVPTKGIHFNALIGKLVIDGELVHDGAFSLHQEIADQKFSVLA